MAERTLPSLKFRLSDVLIAVFGPALVIVAAYYLQEPVPWLLPVTVVLVPALVIARLIVSYRQARPWVWKPEEGTVGTTRDKQFPISDFTRFSIHEIGRSYRGVETRSQLMLQFRTTAYILQDALDTFGRRGHNEEDLQTLDDFVATLPLNEDEHARYRIWSERAHLIALTSRH